MTTRERAARLLAAARPLWPVWAVAAAVGAIVLARVREGLQPYGHEGAHYIEHAERLTVLGAWSRVGEPGSAGLIDELDGLFPPLMHLATIATAPLLGHRAEVVAASGLLWLFGLAAGVGLTAWLLSRSRLAAGAAATGALLLPAAHAFATRYYYDLPMTALLWLMVPLALHTWDRRPWLGGLLVGLLWLAADLLKWSSVPFGAFALAAVAVTPVLSRDGERLYRPLRRLGAFGLAALVAGAGALTFVLLAGPESSLGTMADEMWSDLGQRTVGAGGLGAMLSGAATWLGEHGALLGSRLRPDELAWYGVQSITTVLSPLFAAPVLALALLGAIRHPRVLGFVGVLIGAQLLFLVIWIPVVDDRFLLTSLPALVLLAGLGFSALDRRWRPAVAVLAVLCGLWVASEFHLAFPPLPSSAWEATPGESWDAPPLRGWGIALGDSLEQRGWSRSSTTPDNRAEVREEVWTAVADCRPTVVLIPDAPTEAAPAGEVYWLDYRSMLASMRDRDLLIDVAERCEEPGDADLALLAAPKEGDPQACLPGDWVEVARVEASEQWDVALWRPASLGPCR